MSGGGEGLSGDWTFVLDGFVIVDCDHKREEGGQWSRARALRGGRMFFRSAVVVGWCGVV